MPSSPAAIEPESYNTAGIYIVGVKPGVNISAFLSGLKISPMKVWDVSELFAAELQPSQLETLYNQPEVQTIEPDAMIEFDIPRPKPGNGINLLGGPHDVQLNLGVDIRKFLERSSDLSPEKLLESTHNPHVRFIEYEPPSNLQRIALPEGLVLDFM
ncbi:hypothetical protein H0H92_009847 [Tricholoma furcatifolium]|nr:hypothetical protein H0H92_009847 [Tricholoma furcatifolium]